MTKAALEKMRPLIAEIVEQKLLELLGDPEAGLELKAAVKKRLRMAYRRSEIIPAASVAQRLGLKR